MKEGEIYVQGTPDDQLTEAALRDIYATNLKVADIELDRERSTKTCVPNLQFDQKCNKQGGTK
jgi:ABC-type enterochelin transport system ATPase subunit